MRRIEALRSYLPHELPKLNPGTEPELRWVVPTDLYVDETYQRSLRKRSLKLIDQIIKGFVWRKLKPPIVVEPEPGVLHCVDGQHTAIAAATLGVPLIPVIVVEAGTIEMRADSFVGHNRDRIVMDPLDVYKGLLLAKDPDAMDVDNVCRRAGVRIRQVQTRGRIEIGDCSAIGVIRGLIRRHSPMKARKVMQALVMGKRAPISRVEIDAVEAVMLIKRPDLTVEEMATVIIAVGEEGLIRSKVRAASSKLPYKYTLFELYMLTLEKQNAPAPVPV